MLDLMPKISEKPDQIGGLENFIQKYGKVEIQFFPRENFPHNIDFSETIDRICNQFKIKEITIHPPLENYDLEAILTYDDNILKNQFLQCIELSEKYNIKINLIYHTAWDMIYHRAITINKLKDYLKLLEGKNVTLLVENLFMFSEPFDEMTALALCKEIEHPNLRMCLDICHVYCQANIFRENIENWIDLKLSKELCEKYVYQIHFSYTANNDGYKVKETHGIAHPTEELMLKDFEILRKLGIENKQIVTEIAEEDYHNRKSQIQDLEWLEKIN